MVPVATTTQETLVLIEEHIHHLLDLMGFPAIRVRCTTKSRKDDQTPLLHVAVTAGDEGRLLIGVRGAHLYALQHLVRAMMRRHLPPPIVVTVDVNDYLASRERTLFQLAQEAARKAGKLGRAVVLPPMLAAERHTIHAALAARLDIRTESLGEEPNRRVVVRPVFM